MPADASACSRLNKDSHPAILANPDKPRQVHKILGDIWRHFLYADVMNKQEAAEFLGVSVRAPERYVQQGRIGGHYEKGKTRPTLVFNAVELEAFKAELEQKLYKPVVEPSNPDNAASNDKALTRLSENSPTQPELAESEHLAALIEALFKYQSSNSSTPAYHKLLLTLADAQELTGLSRAILRQAISEGTLKAQVIGKSWRIKYTDLERYVEKLF